MDIDIIGEYIKKRLKELEEMMLVYDFAGQEPPIDLLARHQEIERLQNKLDEYKDVKKETDIVVEI